MAGSKRVSVPDILGREVELTEVLGLVREAILEVYQGNFSVDYKADQSPVTLADRRAHTVLSQRLTALWPDIPVLSEESDPIDYAERREWKQFWLVDPLDGTKEFVRRNGEFTVNVALMEDNSPVLGIIDIPVTGDTYWGARGWGAFRVDAHGIRYPLETQIWNPGQPLTVAASRSHHTSADAWFRDQGHVVKDTLRAGSALKFCWIAESRAEAYVRIHPTMEWDVAAGQALVEATGGHVVQLDGSPLRYNKPDLHNPSFVALAQGLSVR